MKQKQRYNNRFLLRDKAIRLWGTALTQRTEPMGDAHIYQ